MSKKLAGMVDIHFDRVSAQTEPWRPISCPKLGFYLNLVVKGPHRPWAHMGPGPPVPGPSRLVETFSKKRTRQKTNGIL